MAKTVYETIYNRLVRLGLDFTNLPKNTKSSSPGFMDLHCDFVNREEDTLHKVGTLHIVLAHYYEHNGDLIPDPDMEIRIYPAEKLAEALTYQDTYGYREVYPEVGKVDAKAKTELNRFLAEWLKNCIDQGHRFTRGGEPCKE